MAKFASGLAVLGLMAGTAQAAGTVTVDRAAGYILFPKVVSDPTGLLNGGTSTDTVIQITNTSGTALTIVHCFYVDATPRCSNGASLLDPDGACLTTADCNPGGICAPGWQEENFDIQLTTNQPVGWQASSGILTTGLCTKAAAGDPPFTEIGRQCSVNSDCGPGVCSPVDFGRVPPLAPGVFQGELKCIQVDGTSTGGVGVTTRTPVNRNDLIGNATIYDVSPTTSIPASVDTRAYNAIGIQSVLEDGALQTDPSSPSSEKVMCLGATAGSTECPTAEYAQCPSTLILDHLFDVSPLLPNPIVTTDLTLVPCTENLENGRARPVTALQFLVFNEFEQRFSASTTLDCFKETALSNIDRQPGQERTSIFNVAVQGTLSGQTKIRPVLNNQVGVGNGILAVAELFMQGTVGPRSSAAYNLNMAGVNIGRGDFVRFTP